jgi:hypothetical protein
MLIVAMVSIAVGGLLLVLMGRLLLSAIRIQEAGLCHNARMATTESLVRRLQDDALGAAGVDLAADRLRLHAGALGNHAAAIEYVFGDNAVTRLADGKDQRWQAEGLEFEWQTEAGPAGVLGLLSVTERRPARPPTTYEQLRIPISLPLPLDAKPMPPAPPDGADDE